MKNDNKRESRHKLISEPLCAHPELLPDISIEDLHKEHSLGLRAYNALSGHGYQTIKEVALESPKQLLRIPNFGRHSLLEVKTLISSLAKRDNEKSIFKKNAAIERAFKQKEMTQKLINTSQTIKEDLSLIENLVRTLKGTERDLAVLKNRLGLEGEIRSTLQEIADEIGVSRQRVRQIEVRMLQRLQTKYRLSYHPSERYLNITKETLPDLVEDLSDHGFKKPYKILQELTDIFTQTRENREIRRTRSALIREYLRDLRRQSRYSKRQNKIREHLLTLIGRAPENATPIEDFIRPRRPLNPESYGTTGSFFSEKNQKDMLYESIQEYTILGVLEHMPEISWYDVQCIRIPCRINSKEFEYTPDIICRSLDGKVLVLEVKPRSHLIRYDVYYKARSAKSWCQKNKWFYGLISRSGGLEEIIRKATNSDQQAALLEALKQHDDFYKQGIKWQEYKALRDDANLDSNESLLFFIKNNLALRTKPSRIVKLSNGDSWAEILD